MYQKKSIHSEEFQARMQDRVYYFDQYITTTFKEQNYTDQEVLDIIDDHLTFYNHAEACEAMAELLSRLYAGIYKLRSQADALPCLK